jgi:hypothetical protein
MLSSGTQREPGFMCQERRLIVGIDGLHETIADKLSRITPAQTLPHQAPRWGRVGRGDVGPGFSPASASTRRGYTPEEIARLRRNGVV